MRINFLLSAAHQSWAVLGRFPKVILILCSFAIVGASVPLPNWFNLERDKSAPVDWGYGPGKGKGFPRPNLRLGQTPSIPKSTSAAPANAPKNAAQTQASAIPSGGGAGGYFSAPFPWAIIPSYLARLSAG